MTDTFESALTKLEEIVRHLESGDFSLDESLKAFESGLKWARFCEKKLGEAEGKVEILLKKENGDIATAPFNPGRTDGD